MSSEVMFWIGAIAMIVVAMGFLLPPLLGRSKAVAVARKETNLVIFEQRLEELKQDLQGGELNREQFAQAEADLKRELLADMEGEEQQLHEDSGAGRVGAIAVLVIVPVIALGVYTQIGSPDAVDVAAASQQAEMAQSKKAFEDAVAKLEQKLEQEPKNTEGWLMLTKSYRYLGKGPQEIVEVFQRALKQVGDTPDPQLLLEYGEALADLYQGNWEGEPIAQLSRALEIDPNHTDTLWFSGHIHFEQGKYQQALGFWERLAKVAPPDAEVVNMVNQAAAEAQRKLGVAVVPLMDMAAAGRTLQIAVALDAALSDRVSGEDVVVVYARATGENGPPLAARRLTVADLPATIQLDDSMAMMPGNNLSSVENAIIGARVTKSGVATGGAGDLIGMTQSPTQNSEVVQLTIDRILE